MALIRIKEGLLKRLSEDEAIITVLKCPLKHLNIITYYLNTFNYNINYYFIFI